MLHSTATPTWIVKPGILSIVVFHHEAGRPADVTSTAGGWVLSVLGAFSGDPSGGWHALRAADPGTAIPGGNRARGRRFSGDRRVRTSRPRPEARRIDAQSRRPQSGHSRAAIRQGCGNQ